MKFKKESRKGRLKDGEIAPVTSGAQKSFGREVASRVVALGIYDTIRKWLSGLSDWSDWF